MDKSAFDTLGKRLRHARKLRELSQEDLATQAGVAQSDVSKLERGYSQATVNIVKLARALNVRAEWLDTGEGDMEGSSELRLRRTEANGLEICQMDTGGAMGYGLVLQDQPGTIQSWNVSQEWVQKNVHNFTATRNLAIVTGFGDSMRPLFNPGDPLLVDRGVTSVEFDAIYFFRIANEGFVKRLQRIPGNGLLVISENASYRDWNITKDMDFEVFARVIKVWKGEDF